MDSFVFDMQTYSRLVIYILEAASVGSGDRLKPTVQIIRDRCGSAVDLGKKGGNNMNFVFEMLIKYFMLRLLFIL